MSTLPADVALASGQAGELRLFDLESGATLDSVAVNERELIDLVFDPWHARVLVVSLGRGDQAARVDAVDVNGDERRIGAGTLALPDRLLGMADESSPLAWARAGSLVLPVPDGVWILDAGSWRLLGADGAPIAELALGRAWSASTTDDGVLHALVADDAGLARVALAPDASNALAPRIVSRQSASRMTSAAMALLPKGRAHAARALVPDAVIGVLDQGRLRLDLVDGLGRTRWQTDIPSTGACIGALAVERQGDARPLVWAWLDGDEPELLAVEVESRVARIDALPGETSGSCGAGPRASIASIAGAVMVATPGVVLRAHVEHDAVALDSAFSGVGLQAPLTVLR